MLTLWPRIEIFVNFNYALEYEQSVHKSKGNQPTNKKKTFMSHLILITNTKTLSTTAQVRAGITPQPGHDATITIVWKLNQKNTPTHKLLYVCVWVCLPKNTYKKIYNHTQYYDTKQDNSFHIVSAKVYYYHYQHDYYYNYNKDFITIYLKLTLFVVMSFMVDCVIVVMFLSIFT